jgi:hypothetical protein
MVDSYQRCSPHHVALAACGCGGVCELAARVVALIRIDAIWLATEPLDMRAGTDTVLARVVKAFGAARPHHAYLFVGADSGGERAAAMCSLIDTARAQWPRSLCIAP